MRVEGQQLSELAAGPRGAARRRGDGHQRGLLRHVLGRPQPVGEVHVRRDHPGRLAAGRHADRRHLHGGLPRHLSRPPAMTDATPRSRATLRRALGLRTVVTTSTGLAFAALEYLAAAGLVAYVAGDSACIPIIVAGVLALLAYGFFGELNGMFPTAAAIRLYMKRSMDDRAALDHHVHLHDDDHPGDRVRRLHRRQRAWRTCSASRPGSPSLWILGLLTMAVVTNLRGINVAGLLQDVATSVVRPGHARHRCAGAGAQRPRAAHALPAAARAQPGRPLRGGGARRLPLQRLRVGDHQRRGGAPAGVDQPGHAHRRRHPVRRVLGGHGRHEPHPHPQRAHLGLPSALPRHRRHRALRACG